MSLSDRICDVSAEAAEAWCPPGWGTLAAADATFSSNRPFDLFTSCLGILDKGTETGVVPDTV